MSYRVESDFLGEKHVPAECYWGIHTQRALENFPRSLRRLPHELIMAFAMVKKAACLANLELGYLAVDKAEAVVSACDEIVAGKLAEAFPLDPLSGGAGTSFNMNVNEVIANRAIEISGGRKGEYGIISPIETVNLHQSTNDVFPTALKISLILKLRRLSQEIEGLQGAFQRKEKEFSAILKVGRTELQEAVPVTLGSEFSAFAEAVSRDRWRTFKCEERLRTVNIGGTAVGSGLTAPRSYIFLVIEKLRAVCGLGICRGENGMDQTANTDCFVEVSGMLKAYSVNLVKICNDLRMMNLLGEVRVSSLQAGSSIMPAKVNPVLLEAVIQRGIKVMANDFTVSDASCRASFQINEFMPLLAHALLDSLEDLCSITPFLTRQVDELKADKDICRMYFDRSFSIITAFLPHLGYDTASALASEFISSGKSDLRKFLSEKLGEELVAKVLAPENITSLGYSDDD